MPWHAVIWRLLVGREGSIVPRLLIVRHLMYFCKILRIEVHMYVTWDTPPLFETSTSTMRLRHFCHCYTITSQLNNIHIRYIFMCSAFFCMLTVIPGQYWAFSTSICFVCLKRVWGGNKLCLCVSCYETGSFQQLRQQTSFWPKHKKTFFFPPMFSRVLYKESRWVTALWYARGSIFQYFLSSPTLPVVLLFGKKGIRKVLTKR